MSSEWHAFILTSFRASFGHSCGRFVDHGGHGGRFFLIRFDLVSTLPFVLKE